jgi:hypothetical protein
MNMDMEQLIKAMPDMAEKLGAMMATEALPLMVSAGIAIGDADPAVSITFCAKDGSDFKVTLSIGSADAEADDADECDCEG